jgi:ElaB/YqjD/DUF883 family membrane-anchored ribosome-binding protein
VTQENKPQDMQRERDKTSRDMEHKTSRDMEVEIRDTRAALSDDIKALSDKASPANLKQEAKHEVKHVAKQVKNTAVEKAREMKDNAMNTAGELKEAAVEKAAAAKDATVDTAHQLTDKASETMEQVGAQARRVGREAKPFIVANAMPLGLIGLGAGWLIASRRRQRAVMRPVPAPTSVERYNYYADEAYRGSAPYPAAGTMPGAERMQMTDVMTERDRPTHRELESGKHDIGHTARDLYGKARATFDRAQHKLGDRAMHGRDVVQHRVERMQQASRDLAHDNPLAFALGTLVTGLGLGLLLPPTSREDKLLGPSRERFRQNLREVRDAAQDVRRVAKQTATDTMASVEGQVH